MKNKEIMVKRGDTQSRVCNLICPKMNNKERIIWIDLIKIIACIMVVILHSISIGLKQNVYCSGLWIYYLGTFAIPLFFMVNGYLVAGNLKYSYRDKKMYKKILKIFLIVVSWSFLWYVVKKILSKNLDNIFIETIGSLFQKGLFPHFWFLGSLIIIDLLIPIINKIYYSDKFKIIVKSGIVLNVVLDISFILLYNNFNFIMRENIIQTFRLWAWILFYLLGAYVKKYYDIFNKIDNTKLYGCTLICIILSIIYEVMFSFKLYGNLYAENFYSSFIIILTTFLIFISLSKMNIKSGSLSKLSNLSMGVYIIHPFILNILNKFLVFNNNYLLIITMILALICSFTFSYVISKIPMLKELIKI